MARRTLLDMVQNILSAMDSDEVNSIGDTVESLQVAEVIRETYDYITINIDVPGRHGLIKLDGVGDTTKPTTMRCPSNVEKIEWIKYNGVVVEYLSPEVFAHRFGTEIKSDEDPKFYTSFDDDHLVFNSYDESVDSTLQQSKTLCWGQKEVVFETRDDFIPALPLDMFPRLLSEAKATCFINFKQVANSKEEQRSRQQMVRNQNNRHKNGTIKPIDRLPNYGRRR